MSLAPTMHINIWFRIDCSSTQKRKPTHPREREEMKMALEKKRDVKVEAMWFAAGTAVFMACLERAVSVVSLSEQWRVLVFLALNLLLLAILFTSTRPIFLFSSLSNEVSPEPIAPCLDTSVEIEATKRRNECAEDHREDVTSSIECRGEIERVGVKENGGKGPEMSKEELNERVEAFIAMFRQHLASDGRGEGFTSTHVPKPQTRTYHFHNGPLGGEVIASCC